MANFESLTDGRSPILVALATLVVLAIAGVVVMAIGLTLIGVLIFAAAVPAAFIAWMAAD
jgi:hypothetical protein